MFTQSRGSLDDLCPDCDSSMTVLVSSPEQNKRALLPAPPLRNIGDYRKEHAGASSLNKSSIKTLNSEMNATSLTNITSSSSSSSFFEADDQLTAQDEVKGDIENGPKLNGLLADEKE